MTTFRIAVGRRFAKQGDEVTADFFNIVAWRGLAEFVSKYFTKGRSIVVVGSLQNRSYTDQQGQKRVFTEIIADECTFAGNTGNGQGDGGTFYGADAGSTAQGSSSKPAAATFEELSTEDDLPF